MKNLIDFNSFAKNSTVAVAISGGIDSTCLLHLLKSCEKQLNIIVKAVNVDHSIRGEQSVKDSLFVKEFCKNLGVELKSVVVDAPKYALENKTTLESAGRILRYEFFDKVVKEGFADYIATAHHLGDHFETVLLNLFRGSGLKGLTGIPKSRDYIIRPLISVPKSQIENYAKENGVAFVQDDSNFDDEFSRNYLRLKVIPKILEKFPSAELSSLKTAEILIEEDDFLNDLAQRELLLKKDKYYISTSLSPVIFKRACKLALFNLGVEKDYEKVHFDDLLKLTTLQSGSKICLPKGVIAIKEYDRVCLYIESEKRPFKEFFFSGANDYEFLDCTAVISTTIKQNSLTFDGDKIPKNAVIRTRLDGDVFTKFGGGTKKLKEFFIDKKIPLAKRNSLPLIAVDNEVLLIFGVEISDKIKIDQNTKNKLFATLKN